MLTPLAAGQGFAYAPFSCREQALLPDKVAVHGPLVVVEGAYALLPDWGRYYVPLFLQDSLEEQQWRLLLRNGAKGMPPS